jgi:hypothetical protein
MLRSLFISFCKPERYGSATRRAGHYSAGRFPPQPPEQQESATQVAIEDSPDGSDGNYMTASLEWERIEREKEQDAGERFRLQEQCST